MRLIVFLVVCATASFLRADFIIDDFQTALPPNANLVGNPTRLQVGGGVSTDSATQTGIADVLGGYRAALLSGLSTNLATTLSINSGGNGNLSANYPVLLNPPAPSFSLTYGNNALSSNFSAYDNFIIPVVTSDFNGPNQVDLTVTLTSGFGTGNQQTQSSTLLLNDSNSAHTYLIPFVAFSAIDFSDVDNIVFSFDATLSPDFSISSLGITAVPEPTSAILVALSLVVACGFRGQRITPSSESN